MVCLETNQDKSVKKQPQDVAMEDNSQKATLSSSPSSMKEGTGQNYYPNVKVINRHPCDISRFQEAQTEIMYVPVRLQID